MNLSSSHSFVVKRHDWPAARGSLGNHHSLASSPTLTYLANMSGADQATLDEIKRLSGESGTLRSAASLTERLAGALLAATRQPHPRTAATPSYNSYKTHYSGRGRGGYVPYSKFTPKPPTDIKQVQLGGETFKSSKYKLTRQTSMRRIYSLKNQTGVGSIQRRETLTGALLSYQVPPRQLPDHPPRRNQCHRGIIRLQVTHMHTVDARSSQSRHDPAET